MRRQSQPLISVLGRLLTRNNVRQLPILARSRAANSHDRCAGASWLSIVTGARALPIAITMRCELRRSQGAQYLTQLRRSAHTTADKSSGTATKARNLEPIELVDFERHSYRAAPSGSTLLTSTGLWQAYNPSAGAIHQRDLRRHLPLSSRSHTFYGFQRNRVRRHHDFYVDLSVSVMLSLRLMSTACLWKRRYTFWGQEICNHISCRIVHLYDTALNAIQTKAMSLSASRSPL